MYIGRSARNLKQWLLLRTYIIFLHTITIRAPVGANKVSNQFGDYLQNSQFFLSRGSYEMVKLASFSNNSTFSPNWTFMGFLENVGAEAS